MRISIVTPLFNRGDITAKYIASVCSYLTYEDELILVDNASTDQTPQMMPILKQYYPRYNIIYHRNEKNLGFGTANNIGVKLASGKYIVFLNNDVNIKLDFMLQLYDFLEKHPRCAVGPKLISYPTGWNNLWQELSLIPYLEGWCFALPKDVFESVGGFDENFFLDYEDIDLCLRLHLKDVAMAQINLPIFHPYNGNSFQTLNQDRFIYTKASIKYFQKKWGFTLNNLGKEQLGE